MLTEIERAAWASRERAHQHKPEMALKSALDQIERGEFKNVVHCIVVVIEQCPEQDGSHHICTLQAGELNVLATEGALVRAAKLTTSDNEG